MDFFGGPLTTTCTSLLSIQHAKETSSGEGAKKLPLSLSACMHLSRHQLSSPLFPYKVLLSYYIQELGDMSHKRTEKKEQAGYLSVLKLNIMQLQQCWKSPALDRNTANSFSPTVQPFSTPPVSPYQMTDICTSECYFTFCFLSVSRSAGSRIWRLLLPRA